MWVKREWDRRIRKKFIDSEHFFIAIEWFDFSAQPNVLMLPTKTIKSTITITMVVKIGWKKRTQTKYKPFNFHSQSSSIVCSSMNVSPFDLSDAVHALRFVENARLPIYSLETKANRLDFIGKVFSSLSRFRSAIGGFCEQPATNLLFNVT